MAKFLQNFRKIAALTVAMLAVGLSVNAQTWYILGEYIWSPPNPQGTFEVYQTTGETVTIEGLDYTSVYENNALKAAYRNDGNQVYIRWRIENVWFDEILAYDYDLEEGDFFNDDDEHPMMVTEVSTIIDHNGMERKKIEFSFVGLPDETEYWIEGVGSSRGFLYSGTYQPTDEGAIFHLLCYHVGENLIYTNPVYNTCDVDEVAENMVNNGLSIYPNPAKEIINILNDNNLTVSSVEIIDLTGRVVLSTEKTDNINIAELPEGQYFVRINGETSIVKKLFITK